MWHVSPRVNAHHEFEPEWLFAGGATALTRTFKALIVVILRFNLDDRFYDENFIAERSLHDDMLSNPKVKSITVHIALLIYVLLRVQKRQRNVNPNFKSIKVSHLSKIHYYVAQVMSVLRVIAITRIVRRERRYNVEEKEEIQVRRAGRYNLDTYAKFQAVLF
jgi:hypothetical protein